MNVALGVIFGNIFNLKLEAVRGQIYKGKGPGVRALC